MKEQGNFTSKQQSNQLATWQMLRVFLMVIPFLLMGQISNAQTGGKKANTVISGVIQGDLMQLLHVRVDRSFIDNSNENYKVDIKNDSFRVEFYLDVPQKVTIFYLRNSADVYVEPGDHLQIEGEANNFYYSFDFKGNSAANNDFLREFSQKHKLYHSKFQYYKYKKGIMWYRIHRDMDTDMRKKEPEEFKKFMTEKRTEMMGVLNGFDAKEDSLSEGFKQYMWAEINYYWAYNMLTYGYAFGFYHNIDFQDFFGFMYEVPLQNDKALGSKFYRDFLLGAVNYYCEGPKKLPSPDDKIEEQLTKQFSYGEKELDGKIKAFFQTEIFREAFSKQAINKMMDLYNGFLKNNPHKEFNRKVT